MAQPAVRRAAGERPASAKAATERHTHPSGAARPSGRRSIAAWALCGRRSQRRPGRHRHSGCFGQLPSCPLHDLVQARRLGVRGGRRRRAAAAACRGGSGLDRDGSRKQVYMQYLWLLSLGRAQLQTCSQSLRGCCALLGLSLNIVAEQGGRPTRQHIATPAPTPWQAARTTERTTTTTTTTVAGMCGDPMGDEILGTTPEGSKQSTNRSRPPSGASPPGRAAPRAFHISADCPADRRPARPIVRLSVCSAHWPIVDHSILEPQLLALQTCIHKCMSLRGLSRHGSNILRSRRPARAPDGRAPSMILLAPRTPPCGLICGAACARSLGPLAPTDP